jgi:hypothetical protein
MKTSTKVSCPVAAASRANEPNQRNEPCSRRATDRAVCLPLAWRHHPADALPRCLLLAVVRSVIEPAIEYFVTTAENRKEPQDVATAALSASVHGVLDGQLL